MSQSKKVSLLEICVGTSLGYFTALATQAVVFPLWGIELSHSSSAAMAGVFTIVSIVRGYFVRRLFNKLHKIGVFK